MKGITGNSALDAYQRVAVTSVNAARPAAAVSAADSPAAATEQAAKISISSTARELASQAKPPQDAERVQALKEQVDQGNFQVNPQLIASRMLDALG
jgi:flagellar biosynthesis anti-sigma factor FlgM